MSPEALSGAASKGFLVHQLENAGFSAHRGTFVADCVAGTMPFMGARYKVAKPTVVELHIDRPQNADGRPAGRPLHPSDGMSDIWHRVDGRN
jgi:hypothetical protein